MSYIYIKYISFIELLNKDYFFTKLNNQLNNRLNKHLNKHLSNYLSNHLKKYSISQAIISINSWKE